MPGRPAGFGDSCGAQAECYAAPAFSPNLMMQLRIPTLAMLCSTLTLCACGKPAQQPVAVNDDGVLQTENITFPMPGKTVEVENHGQERFLAVGAMEGVSKDRPANGVTTMHVFEDKATILSVDLNIAVPDDGFFYEAWSANADGVPAVSLGHLGNPFSDVRHTVRFEGNQDLSKYPMVVVTLEQDDGVPAASGVVVAKGTLKPHTR